VRVPLVKIVVQVRYEWGRVQMDELLAENIPHLVNISCVSPVGVVHSCECYSLLLALQGRDHHVG